MPKLNEGDLKRLPLRAIVAFAAWCARRVRPLYRLPGDHPEREALTQAVEQAIRIAEAFATGVARSNAARAADAAAWAANASAGAPDAWTAANAANAAWAAVRAAADATDATTGANEAADAVWAAADATDAAWADVANARAANTAAIATDLQKLLALDLGRFPELGS